MDMGSLGDFEFMTAKKGSGMALFALHLTEMAQQAGYKVVLYPTTEFGVYNALDKERFLQHVVCHENSSLQD